MYVCVYSRTPLNRCVFVKPFICVPWARTYVLSRLSDVFMCMFSYIFVACKWRAWTKIYIQKFIHTIATIREAHLHNSSSTNNICVKLCSKGFKIKTLEIFTARCYRDCDNDNDISSGNLMHISPGAIHVRYTASSFFFLWASAKKLYTCSFALSCAINWFSVFAYFHAYSQH